MNMVPGSHNSIENQDITCMEDNNGTKTASETQQDDVDDTHLSSAMESKSQIHIIINNESAAKVPAAKDIYRSLIDGTFLQEFLNINNREVEDALKNDNGFVLWATNGKTAKRKNNVGHVVQQRWSFGGYCPATGEGFLELVPDRSQNTLLPLIMQHIAPGSIVHSDMWVAYAGIANLPVVPPYQHETVNHLQNFVCPLTGAHTNHVECYWKNCKKHFKTMCGVQNTNLPSHLDGFL